MTTQGGEAVRTGQVLLRGVEGEFVARRFAVRDYVDVRDTPDLLQDRLLVRRPAYTTLYGRRGSGDFVVLVGGRRVWIECIWQQESGSADFKLPYLLKSIEKVIPAREVLIVHGGDGGDGKGIAWLRDEARLFFHKQIWVLHFDDFPRWVREQFIQIQPETETAQENML